MQKVPVLMITYNRLEYTKKALASLMQSENVFPIIIDNASTDGTAKFLSELYDSSVPGEWMLMRKRNNSGVAGAMNTFLDLTDGMTFVGKIDNDTIVQPDWCTKLLKHMDKCDIVQAKHPILKATHPDGFDAWVAGMPANGPLRFNHFVGGAGIVFRRNIVKRVPETEWMLGGWRQFQRENPHLRKAFALDVEIQLLDTNEGGADYSQYPEYYRETKRL